MRLATHAINVESYPRDRIPTGWQETHEFAVLLAACCRGNSEGVDTVGEQTALLVTLAQEKFLVRSAVPRSVGASTPITASNAETAAEADIVPLVEEAARVSRATRHGAGADRVHVIRQEAALLVTQRGEELLISMARVLVTSGSAKATHGQRNQANALTRCLVRQAVD